MGDGGKPKHSAGPPMTLGNMRELGVHGNRLPIFTDEPSGY